jgi:hypothetical protein
MQKLSLSFQKRLVFLPKKVYHVMFTNGHLDALAFYIQSKKKFKNGIFFDATNKKIAKLVGVSESTARKQLAILSSYGLIIRKPNEVHFVNPFKLMQFANQKGKMKGSYFKILKTYKEQKQFVKCFPVLCNLKTQKRMIQKVQKSNQIISNSRDYKEVKKAKRYLKKKSFCTDYVTLSNKSFSNEVLKSKATAQRYKKFLVKEKVIEKKYKFVKTKIKVSDLLTMRKNRQFLDFSLNRLIISNNTVCVQLTNEYILNDYIGMQ